MLTAAGSSPSPSASGAAAACFHCGLPVPPGTHYAVVIDSQRQPMCCHGCEAVAEAIVAAGLTDFYRHRTAPSRRAEDLIPEPLRGLELYDRPDLQKSFVRAESEHVREAALILEGIVCAACVDACQKGALVSDPNFAAPSAEHIIEVHPVTQEGDSCPHGAEVPE